MASATTALIPADSGRFADAEVGVIFPRFDPAGETSTAFGLTGLGHRGDPAQLNLFIGAGVLGGTPNITRMVWEGGDVTDYNIRLARPYEGRPDTVAEFGKAVVRDFNPNDAQQMETLRDELFAMIHRLKIQYVAREGIVDKLRIHQT